SLSYNNKSGKTLIPLRYYLELTYRCNLQCPYCYVGNSRSKEELSTQEWLNIIKQIPFYGMITLVGGEPLLRKDFKEIFSASIKQVFGKVNVVTNGILLDEEILKMFIDQKLLLLSISIDGYGKNHDINRDKEGIFEKITNNLETLKSLKSKNKKPLVDIKTIILENNLDDLPKLYKYCEELDLDFLSLAFLRNNDLKQNSILRNNIGPEFYETEYPIQPYFGMAHLKEVFKELESLSKSGKTKVRWAPKFDYFDDRLLAIENFFKHQGEKPVSEIYKPCMYPWSNVIINPEGDMYPCLSYKIGNIKTKPLKEIWNSPNYNCFRKNLHTRKVFNACQMCCELTPKENH
ncbi:MAG: radical SAM protein, partial [Candidatus Gastranaerophilaceae bacterium]